MHKNLMWTLKQLHLSLEQYGRTTMKDLDLSPTQSAVLHYLLAQKGQIVYAVDLHEILGISKSSVSSALKSLKQKGYLTTAGDPVDDRKKRIALTQKAMDMEQAIEASLLACAGERSAASCGRTSTRLTAPSPSAGPSMRNGAEG